MTASNLAAGNLFQGAGGGGGFANPIIWAWDPALDVAQFSQGIIIEGFGLATVPSTPSVTMVSGPEGPRLRFNVTNGVDARFGYAIWPVIDPDLHAAIEALPYLRYIIGWTTLSQVRINAFGLQGAGGPLYLDNGLDAKAGHYGHAIQFYSDADNERGFRIDNGTAVHSSADQTPGLVYPNPANDLQAGFRGELEIRAVKAVGGKPTFYAQFRQWRGQAGVTAKSWLFRQDDPANGYGAYGAGWDPEILNSIGWSYSAGINNSFVDSFCEIANLYVMRVPEDWGR